MRKKSHISLAKFLLDSMQVNDLMQHKKAFYIGSVLPDLKPSFLTRRHTIDDTFEILIDEIKKITVDYNVDKGINGYYARHLGVITHYLSDYCTYPHNEVFCGSISEHVIYEKALKYSLKEYVKTKNNKKERIACQLFCSIDEIIRIIAQTHKEYLKAMKNVHKDIQYIVELCYKVVDLILSFFEIAIAGLQDKNDYFLPYGQA